MSRLDDLQSLPERHINAMDARIAKSSRLGTPTAVDNGEMRCLFNTVPPLNAYVVRASIERAPHLDIVLLLCWLCLSSFFIHYD